MDDMQAEKYLFSFINYERTNDWSYPEAFKLDRMVELAKEFGNPQNTFESAIIAGSKGKGSTAAILSSVLRMENFRVGLYTSPHLERLHERVQVNGSPISADRLTEGAHLLRRVLDSHFWRKDPPTFFEALTVLAFWHFRQMKVQVAVLEVGLGGLYDSTNIANAKVAGIAPISLEHTDKLGKTIAKIAVQKAGIIKDRQVVVSAPQQEEAESIIRRVCEEREALLWRVGREIKVHPRQHGPEGQNFDLSGPFGSYFDLELSLLGEHQMENAAVAVGMAKAFERKTRMKISDSAVRQGIATASWPGRMEKAGSDPTVLLDGAQNPESARRLMQAVGRHFHFHRLGIVLGVSSDKDLSGMLEALTPDCKCLVATQSGNPRALPASEVARLAREAGVEEPIQTTGVREAIDRALAWAAPSDLVLVTGSLFVVGEARAYLKGGG